MWLIKEENEEKWCPLPSRDVKKWKKKEKREKWIFLCVNGGKEGGREGKKEGKGREETWCVDIGH
ncbi:unnamed protein product [Meloidogyne enterolobii]|uniref:Uncharacterized protein n=1 Tax=Meloidogyne enterolobii TaxID=390850 RepID=A0ACB0XM56_MELEN